MSTDTMTVTRGMSHRNISGSAQEGGSSIPIDFGHEGMETEPVMWQQVERILEVTLGQRYIQKPQVGIMPQEPTNQTYVKRVLVAPGISVKADEYERRYGGINLEQLRQRVSPDLYKAFVRHIGSIHGDPDLDVSKITTIPE